MRSITIHTMQGIGDIFWVYQKLAPHYDEIHLKILVISNHEVQRRAHHFAMMLPKVKSCEFEHVDLNFYNSVAHKIYYLQRDVFGLDDAYYCVNAALERGTRLEDIDQPNLLLETPVKLRYRKMMEPTGLPPYLCVFVAPSQAHYVWSPALWAELIMALLEKLEISTIVLIGARWDRDMICEIEAGLNNVKFGPLRAHKHMRILNLAGRITLDYTIQIIHESKFFLAYQSGLSVIADNYDVPQLMVYFPWLGKLMHAWPKQQNMLNRTYQSVLFDGVNFDALPTFLNNLTLPR